MDLFQGSGKGIIEEIPIRRLHDFYMEIPWAWLGYTVVIVYPSREVILHESPCTDDPNNIVSVRASSKKLSMAFRIWFTLEKKEALQKVIEFYSKGYALVHCTSCNPWKK